MARHDAVRSAATITVLLAALLATNPALAQGADRAAFAAFKRLDHSGENALRPEDVSTPAAARQLFTIIDRNDDGALTEADGMPARRVLHRTGQRRLAASQFSPRMAAFLDADGDGRLELAELRPALSGNQPLAEAAPAAPTPPPALDQPPHPRPCWQLTSQHTWMPLPERACHPRSP